MCYKGAQDLILIIKAPTLADREAAPSSQVLCRLHELDAVNGEGQVSGPCVPFDVLVQEAWIATAARAQRRELS